MNELDQLNYFIGFTYDLSYWPNLLGECGYVLESFQPSFNLISENIKVNPDLILISEDKTRSMIVELKSGSYKPDDLEQLQKYCKITHEDLAVKAFVNTNGQGHTHKVFLVCKPDKLNYFLEAITNDDELKDEVSIVSLNEACVNQELKNHDFENVDPLLDNFDLSQFKPPTSIVQILPDSEELRYRERLNIVLVEFFRKKKYIFTSEDIARSLFAYELYSLLSTRDTKVIKDKIESILEEYTHTELDSFLSRKGGKGANPPKWEIIQKNLKTIQLQALQRSMSANLERSANAVPYEGYNPLQESLFDAN